MTYRTIDRAVIDRCVAWATAGVVREYPHHFPLVTNQPARFTQPRELTPVFYGCYDWHSAVHSHWLLIRCLRMFPNADWAQDVTRLLQTQLTQDGLRAEVEFFAAPHRAGFERPYGWAWLLQLVGELHEWATPQAAQWRAFLRPLETLLATRIQTWLSSLAGPIRIGEHSQTAFALGLITDWAVVVEDRDIQRLIRDAILRFYADDADLPIRWEPSAYDFLSPALAEADVVRRVLPPSAFAVWLDRALPNVPNDELAPVTATDLADGKSAHFAGLNFSRAWMLDGIAAGLPDDDRRRFSLQRLASEHIATGLPVLTTDEYAVTHWVGSFVIYALTERGVTRSSPSLFA